MHKRQEWKKWWPLWVQILLIWSGIQRLNGLGVWFSLWVREVPGSNPGWARFSTHGKYPWWILSASMLYCKIFRFSSWIDSLRIGKNVSILIPDFGTTRFGPNLPELRQVPFASFQAKLNYTFSALQFATLHLLFTPSCSLNKNKKILKNKSDFCE